jgi:hypothetical protein
VNRGKTVGYLECDVIDEDGRLVARATSTCLVLRGEQARARRDRAGEADAYSATLKPNEE